MLSEASESVPPNRAHPEHSVIQEILRRARGEGTVRVKLGLVVEGGGMRGVISGGALVAMERLGLSGVFDDVYGESAGAINSCYFLARQAGYGSTIYTEDLASIRFINPLRFGRVIDLDFAVDEVVGRKKRLNVQAVLESRSRLWVAVTDADSGATRVINAQSEGVPLLRLLKATSAIAPLYRHPVVIGGRRYVDGGIVNPIPVKHAIADGCTHILVLLTRPPAFISGGYGHIAQLFVRPLFWGWNPQFVECFFDRQHQAYNETRRQAFGFDGISKGAEIAVIAPDPAGPLVSLMTTDRRTVLAALDHSITTALRLFGDRGDR